MKKYGIDVSKRERLCFLEPVLKAIKEKDPNVVPFAMNKSYGGPLQMTSTMWLLMDFHSVVDLKGDTTKIVDRYTIPRYVET